jgi:hypothetical protein
VLLTPPPYQQPERLALISTARTDGQQMSGTLGWPSAQWLQWQKEVKSFEALAAYRWTFDFIVSEDGSEQPRQVEEHVWNVAGRLQNGITLAAAQAELATIAASQAQADRRG